MGLRIYCSDEAAPIPKPVRLRLTCDASNDLFPCAAEFDSGADYMSARSEAHRQGWLVTDIYEVFCGVHKKRRRAP